MRDLKYLETFKDTIKTLSKKHRIEEKYIEEMVDDFFLRLRKWITDPRMPTIKITHLGTFYPSLGQINRSLFKSFYWRRLGASTTDELREKVRKLWPIQRRLSKEKRGVWTWEEWKNKNPKDFTED